MEKAYDLKVLAKNLSEDGREITEEAAKALVIKTIDWLTLSADLSENKVDDLLKVMYPMAKEQLLKQADKIDGQAG